VIARALVRDGFGKVEARRLAMLAVSPIEDVAKSLAAALQVKTPMRKRVT